LLVLIPLLLLLIEAADDAQAVYRAATSSPAQASAAPAVAGLAHPASAINVAKLVHWGTDKVVELGKYVGMDLDRKDLETMAGEKMREFLAPLALRTTQFVGKSLLALFVMILATYYFFADGPAMRGAILRLTPIEGNRTDELIDQFGSVTRAVVVATLLSAFVQGLLAGVGFGVAGVGSVFLLTALSMLLTLVPFVGAALVWVPVCLWLLAEGRTTAAVVLAIYCMAVVSTVDNLVKPAVLHGRSNLHPLLALLSVLGGVEALGAIGIFVGPMVVAFLQTLLEMVHTELNSMTKSPAQLP
jgi:predicted PurR-regulated permease PerM